MNNKFQKYIDENFINTVTELVIEWPEGVDDVTISSPLRPDEKPSFSINKQGLWFDHATEEKGDLVSLICMLEDVPKEEAERLIIERGEINPSDFCEFDKPTTEINTFPANRISAIQDQKKYLYTNENGDILFIVGRTDTNQGKKIRPYYYDQEADKIKTGNPLKSARPLYKLHELIPTDKPVLLVEGEKCAEIEVEGYFTTTWAQGCASWKKTDFAPLGNRKVFLWPDNDAAGHKAMKEIAAHIRQLKPESIQMINVEEQREKWDLADAVNENLDIPHFIENNIKDLTSEYDKWVYLASEERIIDMSNSQRLNKGAFVDIHRSCPKGNYSNFLHFLLTEDLIVYVHKTIFDPLRKDKIFEEHKIKYCNTYTPIKITPKKGGADWFIDHLYYLFEEENSVNTFLDWLAFTVQYPGHKINYTPILVGGQGVGKSMIKTAIEKFYGDYIKLIKTSQLEQDFNGYVDETLLIWGEEIRLQDQKYYNEMKPLITDERITLHRKGKDVTDIPNRFNIILSSNYDDAVKLDNDDRRLWVLKSKAKRKPDNYYATLYQHCINDYEYLYGMLLDRDISDFNPKADAPMTEGKTQMLEAIQDDFTSELRELWENQNEPFDKPIISKKIIEDFFGEFKTKTVYNIGKKIEAFLKQYRYDYRNEQITMSKTNRQRFHIMVKGDQGKKYMEMSKEEFTNLAREMFPEQCKGKKSNNTEEESPF